MKPELRPQGPQERWGAYLQEFSRQNGARLTRLGVVRPGALMDDLWLEDGLPLAGVDLNGEGAHAPLVQIMLGREGMPERSATHTVPRVRKVAVLLTADWHDEGLDIEDETGATTLLRFEPRSME